jgi:hypothetical protein
MAGSKSKDSSPGPALLLGMTFFTFLVVFALLTLSANKFLPDNTTQNLSEIGKNFLLLLPDYAVLVMMKLFTFSFVLSLILIFVVIWSANNLMRYRRQMHDALKLPGQEMVKESNVMQPIVNQKWESVVTHINSANPSDWKLAILECDIMLSDILEKMGYMQESIGEKLKSIEPSDFTNIEAAWEAHKIRNQIAHEGSDFMINEREAKRVIGLYELVFREFEYI